MSQEEHMSIKEISPAIRKTWAVKVLVQERARPRPSSNKASTFQRLTLIDKEGTKVQASIFGQDIALLAKKIHPLRTYSISNAVVKPIEPRYRVVPHEYQWTLSGRTPIHELNNDAEAMQIKPQFNFIRFSDVHNYARSLQDFDIIGIVVGISPEKQVPTNAGTYTIQEVMLMDESCIFSPSSLARTLMLTLWEDFVAEEGKIISSQIHQYPIIIGMHLKVPQFNENSVATKQSSSFYINPNLPEVASLRSWIADNELTIKESQPEASTSQQSHSTIQIADIPPAPVAGTIFRVMGSISIRDPHQKFWFMGCSNCYNRVDADYKTSYECSYCQRSATAEPRCCFQVEIRDATGAVTTTIFGKNAEKIFPFTAKTLMDTDKQIATNTHQDTSHRIDIRSFGDIEDKGEYVISLKAVHNRFSPGDKKLNVLLLSDMPEQKKVKLS